MKLSIDLFLEKPLYQILLRNLNFGSRLGSYDDTDSGNTSPLDDEDIIGVGEEEVVHPRKAP